jgi:molybdate transport system permease protein
MTLNADVRVRRGSFELEVGLAASPGETIAVVGPNGSGKTTLLRVLAGLQPCTGTVVMDGTDVSGLPSHLRPVGWVPQDGALFPHLDARDNVAFGIGGRRGRRAADRWLDLVGVGDLADRRPAALSGGQAQKVALARALAREPRLLLLDEPMAALDASARVDVRRTLRRHLADFGGVTLLVTHDPVDALSLADRVLALDGGRLVQFAPTADLARAPRTPWLASLLGANGLRGRVAGSEIELDAGGSMTVAEPAGPDGAPALAVVPAHGISLHAQRPAGSPRNAWPVVVRDITVTGSRARVHCTGRPDVVAEITPQAVADLRLDEGIEVWASVKATEITVVLL